MAKELSPDQCVLLTVHLAAEGNIKALHSFTPTRLDVLSPELVLRILLTYLPATIEPREYTTYVSEVASRLYLDVDREEVQVDVSSVRDLAPEQARRRVKKLQILEIRPPKFPLHAPPDLLTCFLCYRSYIIDSESGLLNLIPQLIEPFLTRNDFIRTWYISVVLPVLRLEFEYYPEAGDSVMSLAEFETLSGKEGLDFLLKRISIQNNNLTLSASEPAKAEVLRDVRGLVGPWMYGHTERKRRRVEPTSRSKSDGGNLNTGLRKISLSGVSSGDFTGHDWEYMFRWMVYHAEGNFPLVTHVIEEWRGPSDVDLGGYARGNSDSYLDQDILTKLERQYAQAAFACCYAVEKDTEDTIRGAHGILVRLAELLDFVPPPDLATSVELLPRIERHAVSLEKSDDTTDLGPAALLRPEHPLTTPRMETYMLLQLVIYSAYQFLSLGLPISPIRLVKLHFYASVEELLVELRSILRRISKPDSRKDPLQWAGDRAKLIWLWNWGIDADDAAATEGSGVFGRIPRQVFHEEILKCLIETGCYKLVVDQYLHNSRSTVPANRVEAIVLQKAMEAYDGASNGNKTRGNMKKANEMSIALRQAMALIAATHSLSFYSLTLQHGVPFQPVSIRVNPDPVGLLSKVLEQNPRSYTKVDDLIGIGSNLVTAGLPKDPSGGKSDPGESDADIDSQKRQAERRILFMAIEAALREDDFETAYSYVVSRLTPSGTDIKQPGNLAIQHKRGTSASSTRSQSQLVEDDISWRAAFLAGRYRPTAASPPSIRRLEQRTELLSLALLLAPVSALTEILAAWRRCEEETSAMQLSQQQEEEEFDDRADKRLSGSGLPGNFTISDNDGQPAMLLNQKRREMGRMSDRTRGRAADEVPVSMFDLTRSAAQALRQNSWVRGGVESMQPASMSDSTELSPSESDGHQRVRKRDMVANAASGALASGLGWMLGATPAQQQHEP